jgi:hypothetical protein
MASHTKLIQSTLFKLSNQLGDGLLGIAGIDTADLLENYVSSNTDEGWMSLEMAEEDLKSFLPIDKISQISEAQHDKPPRKKPAYTSGKKALIIPQANWQKVSRSPG